MGINLADTKLWPSVGSFFAGMVAECTAITSALTPWKFNFITD
jgi:hypothetical protein